jgi:mRNA interferase MazF
MYPSHVLVVKGRGGLTKDSVVVCEQIRAISTTRLIQRMGALERSLMTAIEAAVKITLDLS